MSNHAAENSLSVEVLVIGGGPAGLQAALTLGRMHRSVLLVDSGQPRNAPASHMHNFITRDGTPPAEFRAIARGELASLDTVTLLKGVIEEVRPEGDTFIAHTDSGMTVRSRRVVLATGMRDHLPEVPGVAEHFGDLVHHCPFCHGHELAGKRVGVLADPRTVHLTKILAPIAAEVVLLEGAVRVDKVDGRAAVTLGDGSVETVDGLFVATVMEPSAPHGAQLGVEILPSGAVAIDVFGRTTVPGVFAAGDGAHHRDLPMPMASVLAAAAAGQSAATSCVASLL